MDTWSKKIKELRRSKGLRQSDIADFAGIKQSSYANIENGKTNSISIYIGKKIADKLGVDFNELFDIGINEDHQSINLLKTEIHHLKDYNQILKNHLQEFIGLFQYLVSNKLINTDDPKVSSIIERINDINKERPFLDGFTKFYGILSNLKMDSELKKTLYEALKNSEGDKTPEALQ